MYIQVCLELGPCKNIIQGKVKFYKVLLSWNVAAWVMAYCHSLHCSEVLEQFRNPENCINPMLATDFLSWGSHNATVNGANSNCTRSGLPF